MAAADRGRAGHVERDIEQAITALKKGAYLLKYGRRGKPKFCPFRLSNDESVLIWFSGKEEKHVKLSHVARIMPGQRTAIFQRYRQPEKERQSFSLIYNERSLDLICKDKDEAEVWFSGLKTLISRSHYRRWRTESRSDGVSSGTNSPRTYTRRSSPLNSPFGGSYSMQKSFFPSDSVTESLHSLSSGCSDSINGHTRVIATDVFRVSLSSAVSSSSQGSGHDDGDALGDVFIWDVQNVSCGGKHAALVTKQGEIYTWGEESGGRLGHGVKTDVSQPRLVDALVNMNIELVACGEHRTCAVTLSGDLYTWGDGTSTLGLLGNGNEMSHWLPKMVSGPLEGIHVSSVSCGPWHTAVVTSSGQLFTFGDGTFGVLGHGDRRSISVPREVGSLRGLCTVRAACGVWHTAAVVEVISGNSSSSNCSSGKLFTWGDGDKGRLGHGDKENRLVPTCVAALVEPNFCQVACGHSLTVSLTTSGHVYTMGSAVYGQLGNPQSDGKLPVRVEGKLLKNFVEEISCGAYHVAVLTSRTEVYTWGKGANGRLGHRDTDDRNSPTLVEALKDKQVRNVVCGTNFTAAICIHKWVSGVDQSMCSGCRLPFNFKRKRHNCYNCALGFCHSCSNKKSLRASMAPNPHKPYRVCDNCFIKLSKPLETDSSSNSAASKRGNMIQGFSDMIEEDKLDPRSNFFSASVPGSRIVSRATSPVSRRTSPPRSTTPNATLRGLTSPRTILDSSKSATDSISQEVLKLRAQVNLQCKASRLKEILNEGTRRVDMKIGLNLHGAKVEESFKTHTPYLSEELKDMAERLPVGAAENSELSSSASFNTSLDSSSFSDATAEKLSSMLTSREDANGSSEVLGSNGQSTIGSRNNLGTPVSRNGSKVIDADPSHETEWVEQDEPGVYITLTSLPEGARDLKRVRFSRKRFSEKQAEQWWAENRARVYEQYSVRTVNRSTPSVGNSKRSD
ncbi:unnamed protein product [Musa acuminata subsp. burmannicoides]